MTSLRDLLLPSGMGPVESVAEDARTVGDLLGLRARKTPHGFAHMEKHEGVWRHTSWLEFYDQARCVAGGLLALGLEPGDKVSILGPTHAAWGDYEMGGQLVGMVTVGIYLRQSVEQVRFLLDHSETRVVFVAEAEEMETVLAAVGETRDLRAIVPWSDELAARYADVDERVLAPTEFFREPLAETECRAKRAKVDPEEPAILIYTSGTTGPPKGAMITHRNLLALLAAHRDMIPYRKDDLLISFLPMAHATERNLAFYCRLNNGIGAAYASSMGGVLEEVKEVRPTIFGSVPRIFEKAHARIYAEMENRPAPVRSLFHWAVRVGRERAGRLLDGRSVPPWLEWKYRLAERLILHKIQAIFGGRVRLCVTGAAPISLEILEFFWAVGLPVFEAYGMTEATVLTHINRLDGVKLGTVGKVVGQLECKLAEDGEVLLRGPLVFKGYFKNEEATAEALRGGWLHSGDIGTIDEEGFLRITDRKKHLIITAGGKNVAPANIERAIKSQSPMISQVHAHGDRRPYVAALLAPSPLETLAWGVAQGLLENEAAAKLEAELLADPASRSSALQESMAKVVAAEEFRQIFIEPVRQGNRLLARVERVRRFYLLDRDFSQEEGELTPTLKMKRKFIEQKHAETFDRIYGEEDFAINVEPS